MPRPLFPLLTLALLTASLPASAQQPPNASIEVKDGVRLVHNRGALWGSAPRVVLELVRRIGDLETQDPNLLLFRPSDVVRDGAGNVYVLDTGNNRIQKFGPDGGWQATIGRQGAGPAELNSPFSFGLAPDGLLHVCDLGNMRIQVFTPAGDQVRSVRIGAESGKRFTAFRMSATGEYLTRTAPAMMPNEDPAQVPLLSVFDPECRLVRSLGTGSIQDFGDFVTTVFMSVNTYETDRSGNIYLAFAYQNRIEKYTPDGRLLWRADRPLDFRPVTRPASAEEVVQVANAVATDGHDRVWVLTSTRIPTEEELENLGSPDDLTEEFARLDVFDPDGILLERLPLPGMGRKPPLPPIATPAMGVMRIFGDRLYLVDMMGRMCVWEFRIVEREE